MTDNFTQLADTLSPCISFGDDDKSSKEKRDGIQSHCFVCGGHGFPDKKCPSCGMEPAVRSMNLDKRPRAATVLLEKASSIKIPQSYIGITWDVDILRNTHKDKENDRMFQRYAEQLDKIHSIFATGKLPNKSAILIAPPQHSKVTFAYSCMQCAIDHGYSVMPLLDTQEVKRLITLAAERPSQQYGDFSYEEYINADVVFITVTKTTYREEAYQVIEEMLDKRSRRDLPTFFISRYNLQTMSKRDWNKSFDAIKDFNGTENSLKYPAIINYSVKAQGATKGI